MYMTGVFNKVFRSFGKGFNQEFIKSPFSQTVKIKVVIFTSDHQW